MKLDLNVLYEFARSCQVAQAKEGPMPALPETDANTAKALAGYVNMVQDAMKRSMVATPGVRP